MSLVESLASRMAFWQGTRQAWIKLWASCSNCERVSVFTKCLGTPPSAEM